MRRRTKTISVCNKGSSSIVTRRWKFYIHGIRRSQWRGQQHSYTATESLSTHTCGPSRAVPAGVPTGLRTSNNIIYLDIGITFSYPFNSVLVDHVALHCGTQSFVRAVRGHRQLSPAELVLAAQFEVSPRLGALPVAVLGRSQDATLRPSTFVGSVLRAVG